MAYIFRSPSNWTAPTEKRKKKTAFTQGFFTVNQSYVMKASPFYVSVLLSELEKRTKWNFTFFDFASFRCKSRNSSQLIMKTVTNWRGVGNRETVIREHAHCASNRPICLLLIKYDIITAMIPAWSGSDGSYQFKLCLALTIQFERWKITFRVFLLQGATVSFRLYFSRN